MASDPTASFGVKFGDIDDLHRGPPASFAALGARYGRPLRVAILSDFTRISYANGAVFQTRFLYQRLRRCGHEVTVIGPRDPDARAADLAPGTIALPSVPLKAYPGLHLPMPLAPWIFDARRWTFDVCFAQATSLLLEFGVWLRETNGVPLLCVNTTHLPAAYDVLLPERLSRSALVQSGLHLALRGPCERLFARIYNRSDGLIVLSDGLGAYWRERGVRAPIHVVPRVVEPDVFDGPIGPDPYAPLLERAGLPQRGPRLLCAGRHTREKSQDRLIRIFAEHVVPEEPHATLTLVGAGPDTDDYRRVARDSGAADRVFFTGEVPWTHMADYYRYADAFVHASLSETYGNVLGEALWCGTPVVAFADGMGVSSQIDHAVNGVLVAPGRGGASEAEADRVFGRAVLDVVRAPHARAQLGAAAAKRARERCSPAAIEQRLAACFHDAQEHALGSGLSAQAQRRPNLARWWSALRRARSWMAFNGAVYLSGHLRPPTSDACASVHPQFADADPR